jgi:hypothetical protein
LTEADKIDKKKPLIKEVEMKIFRIAFILIMVSLVLIAAQEKKPRPPQVEQKVVVVLGDQAWTDTGLTLKPQDRVTITASGKVCFSGNHPESCVGPEGWNRQDYERDWPGDYYHCNDPLPSVNHAALIGGIENNNFFVGKNLTFHGKRGQLFLGINDCSLTGEHSNTGEFSAVIKVERNAVPTEN